MASAVAAAALLPSSSAAALKRRALPTPFLYNPLSVPVSVRRPSSRCGSWRVRATTLREEEGKVVVEGSLSLGGGEEVIGGGEDSGAARPGKLERWAIKVEQSFNVLLTESAIKILDKFYGDRDYARFFVLETIARIPYFAFISVLHMYESFGWWRRADYLKVHFAESWNELHHLLIMEELGGNASWFDRFIAQHIAILYYFMTVAMYIVSPRMAYHFSECVERHAFSTYDKFIKLKEEELKRLPAPEVAIKYYMNEDLYLFDEFQTHRAPLSRRPKIDNLYDVFVNIRDDEAEHCKTMKACQTHGNLQSPHSNLPNSDEDDSSCLVPQADCEGVKNDIVNQIMHSLGSRNSNKSVWRSLVVAITSLSGMVMSNYHSRVSGLGVLTHGCSAKNIAENICIDVLQIRDIIFAQDFSTNLFKFIIHTC